MKKKTRAHSTEICFYSCDSMLRGMCTRLWRFAMPHHTISCANVFIHIWIDGDTHNMYDKCVSVPVYVYVYVMA